MTKTATLNASNKNTKIERQREREGLTELYFSTVKILAQRPTHISAVATVLLIAKTHRETGGQIERQRQRDRQRQ